MIGRILAAPAAALALVACASVDEPPERASFQEDREAILAMAGTYKVTFDFEETVPLVQGYELKKPKRSGAYEVVRVVEDKGDFISLQHTLVVGDDEKFPIKHWRQDWTYEPDDVLVFIGGNAWKTRDLSAREAAGKWSQEVYQVDDSPRYGAVGAWSHANGVSEWTPPAELRPLPRRDMTTRNDYDAILAVNRHAITPSGWVHEQDNTKLVLAGGEPRALVREVGVNTYVRFDGFDASVADRYSETTAEYWSAVQDEWARLERENDAFGLTIQGEPEELYQPLLGLAQAVADGERNADDAAAEAKTVISEYTTTAIGTLESRVSVRLADAAE